MEQLKTFITAYGKDILYYAAMFLAYFLIFIFKNKVSHTRDNLNMSMTEQLSFVKQTDQGLRDLMQGRLLEAETRYKGAVEKVDAFNDRVARVEKMLEIFLEEVEEDAGQVEDEFAVTEKTGKD